ncbi:hypothetical protein COLO4_26770 [Corchorus olitorius]|uniref:DUF4283 domain-containing protein n=1 Tax=Corchorus olitorius TaxID=93759 RepID=A0A1R3HUH6_9ROSI|nr:hypothetical protein COLO4_26770 [Corchorus olitorius]
MKIETVHSWKILNRRFAPYFISKPCTRKIKHSLLFQAMKQWQKPNYPTLSRILTHNPEPPQSNNTQCTMSDIENYRISHKRECSWTDSDSSSPEHSNDATNGLPPPPIGRRSHRISFPLSLINSAKEEAQQCVVGFLMDIRKFSSANIQRMVNQAWRCLGTTTVKGRADDKYLIHLDHPVDRKVALERTPWSLEGALFVTVKWNPNTPLSQLKLERMEAWLQIWDLPIEYQQPHVAETMAQVAGEVIRLDWDDSPTRNIRYMRVRIAVDPRKPLAAGCTLEMDNGYTMRIPFSYKKVTKLCLSCGIVGHTMGFPIVYEPNENLFSNSMRAFFNRSSRRTTRLRYNLRNGGRAVLDANRQIAEIPNDEIQQGRKQITIIEDVSQPVDRLAEASQDGFQNFTRGESSHQRLEAERGNGAEVGINDAPLRDAERDPGPLNIETGQSFQMEQVSDNQLAGTTNEMELSIQDEERPLEIEPVPQPTEIIEVLEEEDPYEAQVEESDIMPIMDPVAKFDRSVLIIEQIEGRYADGFQNLSEVDDMRFALAREQARFERVCDELVRQSEQMLEDLQNRRLNDPLVQPNDNRVRWIEVPGGGPLLTNARVALEQKDQAPESSSMGARRGTNPNLTRREEVFMEFCVQVETEELSLIDGSHYSLSLQNAAPESSMVDIPPVTNSQNQLIVEEEIRMRPAFICTMNEEDMVTAFLMDTPSPESPQVNREATSDDVLEHYGRG